MANFFARFDTLGLFLLGYLNQKIHETEPTLLLDIRKRITNICRHADIAVFQNIGMEF